jgi:hypothetical protein
MSRIERLQRRGQIAKAQMGGGGAIVMLAVFEFIGRHETFLEMLTPAGVAHVGILVVSGLAIGHGYRQHRDVQESTGSFTREELYQWEKKE